jgi:hypothetical protein
MNFKLLNTFSKPVNLNTDLKPETHKQKYKIQKHNYTLTLLMNADSQIPNITLATHIQNYITFPN